MDPKTRQLFDYIRNKIPDFYGEEEKTALTFWLFEYVWDLKKNNLISGEGLDFFNRNAEKFEKTMLRLEAGEPYQYIDGEVEFLGLTLKVNPNVLIPRPETEDWVNWATLNLIEKPSSIIDLCTGSGCIALALKSKFPNSEVMGFDISNEALEVARANAALNGLEVEFKYGDCIDDDFETPKADLILSNPPYVPHTESSSLRKNVLDYEPESALFPQGNDPLIFFKSISELALSSLNNGGLILFEIHEDYADQVMNLLLEKGFKNPQKRKDLLGKNRLVYAQSE